MRQVGHLLKLYKDARSVKHHKKGGLHVYTELNIKMRHIPTNYSGIIFQLAVYLCIQIFPHFNVKLTSVFVHEREMMVAGNTHLLLVQVGRQMRQLCRI